MIHSLFHLFGTFPDVLLESLLECILISVRVDNPPDEMPTEALLNYAFYALRPSPEHPRICGRALFELLFLHEDRLDATLACLSRADYSEGVTFLLYLIKQRFPAHPAGVDILGHYCGHVIHLPVWSIDWLSYVRTLSLHFNAISAVAQSFLCDASLALMVACASEDVHSGGFTIGVEVLHGILAHRGPVHDQQKALLWDRAEMTMGFIGLETLRLACPEDIDRTLARSCDAFRSFLIFSADQEGELFEVQEEFNRACELLALAIPQVTVLPFEELLGLFHLILDETIHVDWTAFTRVLAMAVASAGPGVPDFGREVILILMEGADFSGREHEIATVIRCFIRSFPGALRAMAGDIAARAISFLDQPIEDLGGPGMAQLVSDLLEFGLVPEELRETAIQ
jgi:hypothetical protein